MHSPQVPVIRRNYCGDKLAYSPQQGTKRLGDMLSHIHIAMLMKPQPRSDRARSGNARSSLPSIVTSRYPAASPGRRTRSYTRSSRCPDDLEHGQRFVVELQAFEQVFSLPLQAARRCSWKRLKRLPALISSTSTSSSTASARSAEFIPMVKASTRRETPWPPSISAAWRAWTLRPFPYRTSMGDRRRGCVATERAGGPASDLRRPQAHRSAAAICASGKCSWLAVSSTASGCSGGAGKATKDLKGRVIWNPSTNRSFHARVPAQVTARA